MDIDSELDDILSFVEFLCNKQSLFQVSKIQKLLSVQIWPILWNLRTQTATIEINA